MLTSAIRLFFVAMLSRQMGKHGVVFNLKLEGHKETFIVGDRRYVPVCTIVFKNLLTLGIFARSPRLMTFAKLYIDGYIDGEGDWFALARIVNELGDEKPSIIGRLITLLAPTTQSIDVHYGWSAEAFALFLDQPYMQYTCGRLSGDDSANLEQAQLNKLELITRWLKLKHGQRHLDVGCGWGGLMKFFADHYSTTSHGVTLSAEQVDYAHRLDCQR
ncbi:MAG: class I SAM-dependent methyltransferase [Candidatus Magasanikbacteria bacterium]